MNDINYTQGTGGASIRPSARPSIHKHWNYPYSCNSNMVRYGLDKDNKQSYADESFNEDGLDEVDNVLSKPAHPIRAPSVQKNRRRWKSIQSENNLQTEDDSDVLSKSAPASLPSYSRCSDDSEEENTPRREFQCSDVSYYSVESPNRNSRSSSYILTPPRNAQKNPVSAQNSSSKLTLFSIAAAIVTVCASFLKISNVPTTSMYDEFKFYTDISGLGEKYNVDENSILQVQTGISTIFERQDTGSFMFVYNSNDNNFNLSEFNKFVNDVSNAASKYLRNDSTPIHYTIVDGGSLNMGGHGALVARYREELTRSGVMLVKHLEDVPSDLAMAFHYYCDEYNPLVKKSAIFFTLNLAKCPKETDKKPFHSVIEKCLKKKWTSIPMDSIGPLLTRVVSVVVDVTSAF